MPKTVITLVAALAISAVSAPATWAQDGDEESTNLAPDGAHAVVVAPEIVLHDGTRDSDLPVIVVHPKWSSTDTRVPLVVFSHGLGGQGSQVLTLPNYWASHGYIVLVPTYRDSLRHKTGQGRAMGGLRAMLGRVRGTKAEFQYRPADHTFLLDSLDAISTQVPGLKDHIDRDHIGAGGHSLGAYTTALVGGARVDLPDGTERASRRDDRVQALLMLSPQGTGTLGLTEFSWNEMQLPMLTVTGSKDGGAGGQTPEWRKEPYLRGPSGDKYHLFVQGAAHSFFTKPPGAKQRRRFTKERERVDRKPATGVRPKSGVLTKLLGDPELKVTGMNDAQRAKLQRKIERVVEQGRGGKRTPGDVIAKLHHLLTQLRAGDWELADTVRDEMLRGSSTTSGEAIDPAVKFQLFKLMTRLFWDAHLKDDSAARAHLTAGPALEPAEGTLTLDHK